MKKLFTTLFCFVLTVVFLPLQAQQVISFDASDNWVGYVNISETSLNGSTFLWGSSWGVADLVAEIDVPGNTITLKPNRINDPAPYWTISGQAEGNKIIEANCYVENDALLGEMLEFFGNVVANSFTTPTDFVDGYTYEAFVKVYAPDYSSVLAYASDPISSTGDYSITLDASSYSSGEHVQYGFQVKGPNVNADPTYDAVYDAIGSIVISNPTLLPLKFTSFDVSVNADRQVELEWETAGTQTGDVEFSVLHSLDGENFSSIDEIAFNQGQLGTSFTYTISTPTEGVNYYQVELKEGDYKTLSSIVKIEVEPAEEPIALFPNPANNQVTISGIDGGATIMSFDGRVLAKHNSTRDMNINSLPNGTYFIITQKGNFKFIKQ